MLLERPLNPFEQRLRHHLAVDDDTAAEKPMAAMLRIALREVETLHRRGVPFQLVPEDPHVIVDVLRIITETFLLAQVLQSLRTLLQQRDGRPFRWFGVLVEGLDPIRIYALGHPVVDESRKFLRRRLWRRRLDEVATGPLDARDLREAHGMTNGDGVGGPRARELLPWPDLEDGGAVGRAQKRRAAAHVRLERFLEQILQLDFLGSVQRPPQLDVEADLAAHDLEADLRRFGLQGHALVQVGGTVDVQHGARRFGRVCGGRSRADCSKRCPVAKMALVT
mmetsp:Transcript_81306/g.248407  ORF Transcript_81306/g.248407 Transcript_81306/m.248407 type:complete len:280 (+) Transcript_81306:398-1237(+)